MKLEYAFLRVESDAGSVNVFFLFTPSQAQGAGDKSAVPLY